MPPVVVHQQPHETRHLAPRCSCAYLCSWFALVVAILVPYFVAFHTNNFWVKEKVWLQQPTVQFKHTALVMVEGAAAGTAAHWSTEPSVNKLYGSSLRVAEVSSFENDVNRDGKADSSSVTLSVPLEAGEKVHHASAILLFNYALDDAVAVELEGLVYVDGSSPLPGSSLWVGGDLRLRQLTPVSYKETVETYKASVLDTSAPQIEDVQFQSLLSAYMTRNLTTYVENEVQVWTPGPGGSADAMATFDLTVELRYVEEAVRYRPAFWELIKNAWVQYLAIFFVINYFVRQVEGFIYNNRVLQSTITGAQEISTKPKF